MSNGLLTTDFGQQLLSTIRINQKWRIRLKGLQKSAVIFISSSQYLPDLSGNSKITVFTKSEKCAKCNFRDILQIARTVSRSALQAPITGHKIPARTLHSVFSVQCDNLYRTKSVFTKSLQLMSFHIFTPCFFEINFIFLFNQNSQIASSISKFLTNISYKTRQDLLRQ